MVTISFLVRERVSIRYFMMKFVDKMTSCQFGRSQLIRYSSYCSISWCLQAS